VFEEKRERESSRTRERKREKERERERKREKERERERKRERVIVRMSKAEAAAPGRSKIFFLWSYQASNIYEGSWYIRGFDKVFQSVYFPIINNYNTNLSCFTYKLLHGLNMPI